MNSEPPPQPTIVSDAHQDRKRTTATNIHRNRCTFLPCSVHKELLRQLNRGVSDNNLVAVPGNNTTAPSSCSVSSTSCITNTTHPPSPSSWIVRSTSAQQSAQQQVWVVHLGRYGSGGETEAEMDADDSSSFRNMQTQRDKEEEEETNLFFRPNPSSSFHEQKKKHKDHEQEEEHEKGRVWVEALDRGRNRVVVRMWHQASRWWNLHHPAHNTPVLASSEPTSTSDLNSDASTDALSSSSAFIMSADGHYHQILTAAKSEIAGYREARRKLLDSSSTDDAGNAKGDGRRIKENGEKGRQSLIVRIPEVLFTSWEDCCCHAPASSAAVDSSSSNGNDDNNTQPYSTTTSRSSHDGGLPWAILEYVGPESTLFDAPDDDNATDHVWNFPPHHTQIISNNGSNSNRERVCCFNEDYLQAMIRERLEFGFPEPHPRWGRLPIDQCIPYVRQVLDVVIMPLHLTFYSTGQNNHQTISLHPVVGSSPLSLPSLSSLSRPEVCQGLEGLNVGSTRCHPGIRYMDMVKRYEEKMGWMIRQLETQSSTCLKEDTLQGGSAAALSDKDHRMSTTSHSSDSGKQFTDHRRLDRAVHLLTRAVEHLREQATICPSLDDDRNDDDDYRGKKDTEKSKIKTPPSVLCHLDLQPQNLLFSSSLHSNTAPRKSAAQELSTPFLVDRPRIASVLDWEEAAYADPRFELLMLGRKVCANKEQAETIWDYYQNEMRERYGFSNLELGAIEPWLNLETVHSLVTLLVQALGAGGRSPWESRPQLWGKIEREFHRLAENTGWSFCNMSLG